MSRSSILCAVIGAMACAVLALGAAAQRGAAASTPPQQHTAAGDAAAGEPESPAPVAVPFRTRHAAFVPAAYAELPGWRDDSLDDAWKALRESCTVLANRPIWSGVCARSVRVAPRSDAIRRFVEAEFFVYQIRDTDQSVAGIITGYYEPLLNGSAVYGGRYRYPVYGVPPDLLYFDSRSARTGSYGAPIDATIEGRNVVPVVAGAGSKGFGKPVYRVAIGDAVPDVRDRKIRVRVEGSRIVPYYTRAEINAGALGVTRPIAWVDSAADLYSMHIQGSGKLRMPGGQILRLAFAEQNGHPFSPPLLARTRGAPGADDVPLLRGLPIDLDAADAPPADAASGDADAPTPRALRGRPERGAAAAAARPSDPDAVSAEVSRVVDLLLQNQAGAAVPVPAKRSDAASATPAREPGATAAGAPGGVRAAAGTAGFATSAAFDSDPSYVFFREIPESAAGPIGAMGVPLTAGRSIAVDPRTTPLGVPVFISTRGAGSSAGINRLMVAQDTGGAIRGAVRADFFWGFGPEARERASRMKESGRMWLLLPKDLQIAAAKSARVVARGALGAQEPDADAECVIADPQLCVE